MRSFNIKNYRNELTAFNVQLCPIPCHHLNKNSTRQDDERQANRDDDNNAKWHHHQLHPTIFSIFIFARFFVVMKKKILLDSLFFISSFCVLFAPSPSNHPPIIPRSFFCGPRKKQRPTFFPLSVRILIIKRKATTIYTCFTTSLCHHDKEGKKWLAMCFWKKNTSERAKARKIWKRNDDKKGIKKSWFVH